RGQASSGFGYFDPGVKTAGSSWTFTFVGAGSYNYKCTVTSGMTGKFKVPMIISPITGKLITVFTVTWSSDKAPTGYVFDIKILRPGITTWKSWKSDQTGKSATFVPDGGLGTYTFKSR